MHTQTHTTYIHTYIHTCIDTHTHTYTHTHIHTHTYIHIHTHTHTHTLTNMNIGVCIDAANHQQRTFGRHLEIAQNAHCGMRIQYCIAWRAKVWLYNFFLLIYLKTLCGQTRQRWNASAWYVRRTAHTHTHESVPLLEVLKRSMCICMYVCMYICVCVYVHVCVCVCVILSSVSPLPVRVSAAHVYCWVLCVVWCDTKLRNSY